MFILFDAQCRKCHQPFKAEVDSGADVPADHGQYRCMCPKCYTPIVLRDEHGAVTATTTGWAVRATAVSGTSATGPDTTV